MLKRTAFFATAMFSGGVHATDSTQTFLTYANEPLTKPLPTIASASPGDRLVLQPGSTNAFSLLMGTRTPGANITNGQAVRDTFFMNYLVGNLEAAIGWPMDTGQGPNPPFETVARHYTVGDPNDLHIIRNWGMALRAICSNNHTNCTMGNIYGAMVRVPFEIRPGMTVKVRYRSPKGPHAWTPIWLFSGSQTSPGPGGNPYANFNTPNTLVQEPVSGHCFEIDMNDDYPRWEANPAVPTGYTLDYLTPDKYGVQWNTPPHWIYAANTGGYTFQPNGGPQFEQLPTNTTVGFHDLVMSWDGTSNTIYMFMDGKLAASSYMEYAQAPRYLDPATNTLKQQAMTLMIGNQAVPTWLPGDSTVTENDGVPDGWTIVVQEISAWYGLINNPNSFQPK